MKQDSCYPWNQEGNGWRVGSEPSTDTPIGEPDLHCLSLGLSSHLIVSRKELTLLQLTSSSGLWTHLYTCTHRHVLRHSQLTLKIKTSREKCIKGFEMHRIISTWWLGMIYRILHVHHTINEIREQDSWIQLFLVVRLDYNCSRSQH